MQRISVQRLLIVLISCTITIGQIEWVSTVIVPKGAPALQDCL